MEFTRTELYTLLNLHPSDRPLWLIEVDLSGANLTGANLSEANLSGADLRGARLYRADLERADLGGAKLGGAYMEGANLTKARMPDNWRNPNLPLREPTLEPTSLLSTT